MNKRLLELAEKSQLAELYDRYVEQCMKNADDDRLDYDAIVKEFAELIVRECAKELREAEQEAHRAYKAKEVKERNTFDGYDFADMLEERFGVEE